MIAWSLPEPFAFVSAAVDHRQVVCPPRCLLICVEPRIRTAVSARIHPLPSLLASLSIATLAPGSHRHLPWPTRNLTSGAQAGPRHPLVDALDAARRVGAVSCVKGAHLLGRRCFSPSAVIPFVACRSPAVGRVRPWCQKHPACSSFGLGHLIRSFDYNSEFLFLRRRQEHLR